MEENCHICGIGTDFTCVDCEKPVCEECCVVPTYHNQLDYALCLECGDEREVSADTERQREWKIEAALKEKKEKQAKLRKAAYWRPENVAKRKAKKEALRIARKEQDEKFIAEAAKIFKDMFRGMF